MMPNSEQEGYRNEHGVDRCLSEHMLDAGMNGLRNFFLADVSVGKIGKLLNKGFKPYFTFK
jgi:hypothetical protein